MRTVIPTRYLGNAGLDYFASMMDEYKIPYTIQKHDDGTGDIITDHCLDVDEFIISVVEECQYCIKFDELARCRYCIGLDDITDHFALLGMQADDFTPAEALEHYADKRELITF